MNRISNEQLNIPLTSLKMPVDDKERIRRILEAQSSLGPKGRRIYIGTFAPVFAAVVLLVTGVGVAFASRDSFPGDALYSVRINVTEPAQGLLIRDDEERLDWDMELLDRRLDDEQYALVLEEHSEQDDAAQFESELKSLVGDEQDLEQTDDESATSDASIGSVDEPLSDIESDLDDLEREIGREQNESPDGE